MDRLVLLWVVLPSVPRVLLDTSMEMNKCEVRFHLYYILYTDRATSQLFGNEQMRGEVSSVLYTIYRPSYLAVVRK